MKYLKKIKAGMILKNHKLKNNDGIKVVIAFTRDISLG